MRRDLLITVLLVNMLVPLGGLSTDIYLPSMPSMCHFFSAPSFTIQMTVSLFALTIAIGQCVVGPISDSVGRKPLIVIGLIVQCVCVLTIILVPMINVLLVARIIQGLAASFMVVPARAILSDCFEGQELKKQFTYLVTSFGLGPVVAPFIGGYLQHYFFWQANFIFILCYAAIGLLAVLCLLKETVQCKSKISVSDISNRYQHVLQKPGFITNVILIGLCICFVALFNVVGPFVIQTLLGYNPVVSGYMALITGLAWFLGNVTSRIFHRVHYHHKCSTILPLMILTGLLMLFLTHYPLSLLFFMAPIAFMIFLGGIVFPTFVGETMSLFKENAASANGLLFSIAWLLFSIFAFIGALLEVHSEAPFAFSFCGLSLFITAWYLLLIRGRVHPL